MKTKLSKSNVQEWKQLPVWVSLHFLPLGVAVDPMFYTPILHAVQFNEAYLGQRAHQILVQLQM